MKNIIYDIYHDESKEEAYWHGFYFVPRTNRDYLLILLNEARVITKYFHQVHYQRIKSKTKCNNVKAIIINSWTTIEYLHYNNKNYIKFRHLFIWVEFQER